MAVKIKLKRLGKIRTPQYRIVIADSRTKRDGRVIEEIGRYVPTADPSVISRKLMATATTRKSAGDVSDM